MKYCILFALLIILVNASAQESFVKGYVVKKSGDSIKGYVNHGSDATLSKSVQFKNQLKAEKVETFTPGDINGFGYENENKYQSITFADPLDGGKQKTEFARFLVEGKNSLYSVFSNGSYYYYLVSRMDSAYILYNEKIRSGRNVQHGNFRNVLHYVTRDCPSLQKYAKTISFSERNLTGYINELNNCVGDKETIIHSKRIKNKAQFLLYAGGISYDKNTMYTFQGQVRLTSPGVSKRTSFVIGLTYTHLVENEYSQIAGAHTDFTTNMITLPFYFQFNFTKSKLQPIAYAGFSVAYTKLVNPDLEDPKGFLEDYGVGFVGGIGLEYYPISRLALKADWRYELRGLYPNIGLAYKIH